MYVVGLGKRKNTTHSYADTRRYIMVYAHGVDKQNNSRTRANQAVKNDTLPDVVPNTDRTLIPSALFPERGCSFKELNIPHARQV